MSRRFACVICLGGTLLAQDLQPFRMPWNDASAGITNLQSWQGEEAGASGWVAVSPEGRYAVNGNRIRFLGVNVTAGQAFPTRERADGHAARLARFGFNGVRFHHLEAPWDKNNVLIDYASGGSRELSAARLDRLHYFIAKLAAHGIYSNINLLVSREFQASDGLGREISQMGWKDQHILGFFNDTALELHKEYAQKLLAAPNPHRDGRALAVDPAVAFVEIMNENGLLQKWYEGVLDNMPATYRTQLQARWNGWLASRYTGTAEMLTAWGAVDEALGDNKVANGEFGSGLSRWNIERHDTAAASVTTPADFDGKPSLKVEVTTAGSANWHVQINQSALAVEQGKVYTLSFWAKATAPTPLSCGVQRAHTDYAGLGPSVSTTLSTEWRQFRVTYQSGVSENNARVNFNGFGNRLATVWIADVRLQPGGKIGGLPEGSSLEEASVPSVTRTGNATLDQRRDWFRFVFALERQYWDAMYAYIKGDLGYRGIVFATIVSNSPPNTQLGMDAMDSHNYWQHPQFPPGLDFNQEQWTIQNVSLVNDRNGGGLGSMSRQRVKGKPHNVTEYQHPSPNTYATEGPLLAAAQASLQDWDSLWFFEYPTGASEYTTGFFDHSGHPGKMANNLVAAAMFRRGDVAPAESEYELAFPPETELNAAVTRGGAWSIADGSHIGFPGFLSLMRRVALSVGPEATGLTNFSAPPAPATVASDTGEVKWDFTLPNRGAVTVKTARTKAVVGFAAGRTFDLDGIAVTPGETRQDWSTIAFTALEGGSLTSPSRGVIVTTGEHANSGMIWNAARTSVSNRWGSAPALIEVISAAVRWNVPASRLKVWVMNEKGERGEPVAVEPIDDGAALVQLGRNGVTLWYEFEIVPDGAN